MLFRCYQLLRLVYYPFFIWLFPLFSSSVRERLSFEKRNTLDLTCRSFLEDGKNADFAFEVSSEGELEQVRPVILAALEADKRVELVFASPSVERQCESLAEKYSANLRVFRMPLLSYFPGVVTRDVLAWLSAPKLILCRYDFFPELLRYGRKKTVEFILLSASLKSYEKKRRGWFQRWVYASIYRSFDKIVAATDVDRQRFLDNFQIAEDKLSSFDFRPLAIGARLERREQILREKFPAYEKFKAAIERYPQQNRLVFGSFWAQELAAFSGKVDFTRHVICIFPHRLDRNSLDSIRDGLNSMLNAPVYEIGPEPQANLDVIEEFSRRPGPIIVNLKGVLCESYPDFGAAFVGGGHGVSVHSLMEPFLGGCMVYCGPKVQRSTEYDLIFEKNPDRIRIVDRLEELFDHFNKGIDVKRSDIGAFKGLYIYGKESALAGLGIIQEGRNDSL